MGREETLFKPDYQSFERNHKLCLVEVITTIFTFTWTDQIGICILYTFLNNSAEAEKFTKRVDKNDKIIYVRVEHNQV